MYRLSLTITKFMSVSQKKKVEKKIQNYIKFGVQVLKRTVGKINSKTGVVVSINKKELVTLLFV